MLLLLSTATGLLSPVAAAMSKDELASATVSGELSSDVNDFFSDILEDALLRTANVAQLSTPTPRYRESGRILFVLSGSADFDTSSQTPASLFDRFEPFFRIETAVGQGIGSSLQPLGP